MQLDPQYLDATRPDPTLLGECTLCERLIEHAFHDLRTAGRGRGGQYGSLTDLRTALWFLLDPVSHMAWAAEAVGADPEALRDRARHEARLRLALHPELRERLCRRVLGARAVRLVEGA